MGRAIVVTGFETGLMEEWDDNHSGSSGPHTDAAMTGTYGGRILSTGTGHHQYQFAPGFAIQFSMLWSFAIRIPSGGFPASDVQLFGSRDSGLGSGASFSGRYRVSDQKLILEARVGGVAVETLVGPVMVADTRYDVELAYRGQAHADTPTRRQMTLVIDGTEIGTLGPNASYLGSWNAWVFGLEDTQVAFEAHVDDILIAMADEETGAAVLDLAFPVGPITPTYLMPDGVGSHVGDTNFSTSTGTLANSWQLIDELPWSSGAATDYVQQDTLSTTSYLEYTFEDIAPLGAGQEIFGACLYGAFDSSSFPFLSNSELHSIVDGVDTKHFDGGGSSINDPFTLPGIAGAVYGPGAWDEATLNDALIRWGYSSNVTSLPRLDAATIIAAVTEAVITPPEPPPEVPGYIGDEVYYDQLGFIEEETS